MDVFLTVDTEVWPARVVNWPHQPMRTTKNCVEELDAYFVGSTAQGAYGVPYHLAVLKRYRLKATFFVDPMFSFALGLTPLCNLVSMIEENGQRVALHLHPEWLTDLRFHGAPTFRGPRLSAYPIDEQKRLIEIGWQRLIDAGARPMKAFRAGSWGADLSTASALRDVGIAVDSSLNSRFRGSFPTLASREELQDPSEVAGIIELPVSRFDDGYTQGGRPLSFVGVSAPEARFVLHEAKRRGRQALVVVLHSNEFVRVERLEKRKKPNPRRIVVSRFERFCAHLHANAIDSKWVDECIVSTRSRAVEGDIPKSGVLRTIPRLLGQVASRWY